MLDINVTTFNEALRLSRCLTLRQFVPGLSDQMIGEIYAFLATDSRNVVSLSDDMLQFVDADGNRTDAYAVEINSGIDYIVLGWEHFSVTSAASSRDSGDSGGCSSNNNNNNNNNNS